MSYAIVIIIILLNLNFKTLFNKLILVGMEEEEKIIYTICINFESQAEINFSEQPK